MAELKKPKSGGKPKLIKAKNPPGGPKTPGAKKAAAMRKALENGIEEANKDSKRKK